MVTDKQFKIYVDLFKININVIVSDDLRKTLDNNRVLKTIKVKDFKPKQRNIDISFYDEKNGYFKYYLLLNKDNQKLSEIISCVTSITHKILHNQKINIRKNNSDIYSFIVGKILDRVIKKSDLENEIAFE